MKKLLAVMIGIAILTSCRVDSHDTLSVEIRGDGNPLQEFYVQDRNIVCYTFAWHGISCLTLGSNNER